MRGVGLGGQRMSHVFLKRSRVVCSPATSFAVLPSQSLIVGSTPAERRKETTLCWSHDVATGAWGGEVAKIEVL